MKITSWLQNMCFSSALSNRRTRRHRSRAESSRRRAAIESLEDRTLLTELIGIDFGGGTTPSNWATFTGTTTASISNLSDESGAATGASVQIMFDSIFNSGSGYFAFTPSAAELPSHTQSLAGVDRFLSELGNVELTYSGLLANREYELYVFAGNDQASNQRVTINSGSSFNQPHNANQLVINDQVGDSNRALSEYAQIVTTDAGGGLHIRVDSSPNPGGFFGLAGIALREAPPPTRDVVIGDVAVSESDSTASFPVSLRLAAADEVILTLATSDGTAVAGQDYTATTSQVTIPAGSTNATTNFTVPLLNDSSAEVAETFTVRVLSVDSGTVAQTTDTGTATISDDDATLTLNIAAASVPESAGAAATTATVSRNTDTTNALTVSLASSDTTEATVPTSVTIPAGQTSVTFDIASVDDMIIDGTETVTITASASSHVDGTDTLNVTNSTVPGLNITLAAATIAETAGNGALTATVARNTDTGSAITVNLSSSDTGLVTVPASITIPAGQTSATFDIDVIDNDTVDGTQAVTLTATTPTPGLADGTVTLNVTDNDVPELTLTPATSTGISETDGPGATTATVRRNTDTTSDLTITLTSDDTSEATVPQTVTIPAGQRTVSFDIDAVDDSTVDGTQTITITAAAAGHTSGSGMLNVTDDDVPTLIVAIAGGQVSEAAGSNAVTATVLRNTDTSTDLVVTLSSTDITAAVVPTSVVIPAGSTFATFSIDAVDDAIFDGTQTVAIGASASGFIPGGGTLDVTDNEIASLTVTIAAASVSETTGAAATTATVTRNTDPTAALTVFLASSDTSEATVPPAVTILAGQPSATFEIGTIDDAVIDGTQTVTITASSPGHSDGTDTLDIADNEFAALIVSIVETDVSETDGASASTATVTRNTDTTNALTVTLTSGDTTELTVPPTVTIPAGQTSAAFDIATVDDAIADGTRAVTVTATALGHVDGTDTLNVTDNEVATLDIAIAAAGVSETAGTGATSVTVTRNTDTAAEFTVSLASSDTSEIVVPNTVTIPAGQTSATVSIDAVDDDIVDGTQTVTVTASAAGLADGTDTLSVTDNDVARLDLTIASVSVSEADTASATITRNTDTTNELTVSLSASDSSQAGVPASVTIPAGQTSAAFDVAGTDDVFVDGTQTVTITAAVAGFIDGTDTLDVIDNDVPALSISIADTSISENGGATTLTVSRNTTPTDALTVILISSNVTEATVVGSVTIPAGQMTSDPVAVTGIDDSIVDGTRTITLTATAPNYALGSETLDIADDDVPALTLTTDVSTISENGGNMTARLSRNTGATGSLTVSLVSSDTSKLIVPTTVTIPDSRSSVDFTVTVIDNAIVDGDQPVTITATAVTFADGTGTVDVTDDDVPGLDISISATEAGEADGAAATSATVTRNTDTTNALTVTLSSSDTTEAVVPATITIPAGQSSAAFDIDTIDDAAVDGIQNVTVTATAAGHSDGTQTLNVTDDDIAAVSISIVAALISETAGADSTTAMVTRNTDTTSALTVQLSSSNPGEINIPDSVTIPAGETSVAFDISSVDDINVDGTQTVTVTGAAASHLSGSDILGVTDNDVPALFVNVVALAINEAAEPRATTIVITRNTGVANALSVSLTSSDTSEAVVPAVVTIPAGEASTAVNVSSVDDSQVDGTQTVTIAATAAGHAGDSDTLNVIDNDIAALLIDIADATVSEADGAGATTATVTRTTDGTSALTVSLSGSSAAAAIPATITIPAGQTSASFGIDTVDNAIVNGTQLLVITAAADAHADGIGRLEITDDETPQLTVSISDAAFDESAGTAATTATVSRNTETSRDLVVTLASSDQSEAAVAPTVTIPAGQASATFEIDAVNDSAVDGTQTVTITARADSHADGSDTVDVTDLDNDALLTLAITPNGVTTTSNPITFTLQFNKEAPALSLSDINVTNGTAHRLTQTDTDTFSLSVIPTASGDVTVAVVNVAVDSSDVSNATPSATVTSNISDTLVPPVLNSMPPISDVVNPTLSWNTTAGANSYEIWFARITPGQSRLFVSASSITDTTWTPPENLTPALYRFWIRVSTPPALPDHGHKRRPLKCSRRWSGH